MFKLFRLNKKRPKVDKDAFNLNEISDAIPPEELPDLTNHFEVLELCELNEVEREELKKIKKEVEES